MRLKGIYILGFCLAFASFVTFNPNRVNQQSIELITSDSIFEAGSKMVLKFSSSKLIPSQLYCSNSFGSTLINPTFNNQVLSFVIPSFMAKNAGVVNWNFINTKNPISGNFKIVPKQEVAKMESYLGPPSIEAGGSDFAMLVVIPTDAFDNALKDSTEVSINHQFLNFEKNETVLTNNLIAYKNIYSYEKTGRILVSSFCLGENSKEHDINVMAAIPTNFVIESSRHHEYADGNQITTFYTSVLKDRFNNTVNDGTYVEFYITNTQGNILKTSGTTINGIANAKMIHPDHEELWNIKAFIPGMAESNTLILNYKKVITDFEVAFSENHRQITVGPLQSFMNQMIPDGLQVTTSILINNKIVNNISKTSQNGFVKFNLSTDEFPNNTYEIRIQAAGIEKNFKTIKLW
ncbi:hypothetical protein [Mariniflexile sp.]|uniref:hypothetical protein n=1 Tax=Mariniflexile sp. TaxID=1979402 RepID=UPI0035656BD6